MYEGYESYIQADPVFYDVTYSGELAKNSFSAVKRSLPVGWRRHEQDDWCVLRPDVDDFPSQGWKIHASATLGNANRVIDKVWDYCVPRGIRFKFLRSESALEFRISKYASREGSGKFVTIYPSGDVQCEQILNELGELLAGEPGPSILSDVRWGKGPLYLRYGAFISQYTVSESDELVPAITDPEGKLVPDQRKPVFHTPPWIKVPSFLQPHLDARNAATVADLPYTFDEVLHFSNGGGVYLGTDTRCGRRVVLKEGRPHAGLDGHRHDAIHRIENEHAILLKLAGIPAVPEVYDLLWVGEHRFLVMEYVEGSHLLYATATKNPLVGSEAVAEDYAEYAEWAMNIHRQFEVAVEAVHDRGIVHGDLHFFNVIVREDNTIALLDFENAVPVEKFVRPGLVNPGFAAPRSVTGFDLDNYASACLRLALFLVLTPMLALHRAKARHLAEIIAEHFPVPKEFLAKAVKTIVPADAPSAPSPQFVTDQSEWPRLREDMVRAIVASATPDRDDRLFPGDPQQFRVGGLGLAYGAAGVLYALDAAGGYRSERFDNWLIQRAKNTQTGFRAGLFDGLHGVAFALDHLGYRQEALDVLDICLETQWKKLGPNLFSGISGIGLSLLHFANQTGEPTLRTAAHQAAELIANIPDSADDTDISGGKNPRAGLLHGRAGQALLLLRAYDDIGDSGFLDRAAHALRQDLKRCLLKDSGVLHVREKSRTTPYLDNGSIGIGIVLDEYLARRHDDQFAEASHGIELAAQSSVFSLPGLFRGRSGTLAYLAGHCPPMDPLVTKQFRNLAWHALPYASGIAFPGHGLMRLSMDLATGTAGILLATGMAHDKTLQLPLLTTAPSRGPQSPVPAGMGL